MNEPASLTVAVPTYNRSQVLATCLKALVRQISGDAGLLSRVDVLVIDNASTDDTQQIAQHFAALHPFISYRRNDRNYGIDGNIHRCCLYATGDFVHLLSDDDVVVPGGLGVIVSHLDRHPDVGFFLLNLRSFVGVYDESALQSPKLPATGDLRFDDPSEFIAYGWVWLTMMSCFVLRRSTWMQGGEHECYIGTDIYLSYALFDHLARESAAMVVAEPVIASRVHYSGSYRIFYAFALQWRKLLLEHAAKLGFLRPLMLATFKRSMRSDLIPRIVVYRADTGEIDAEGRKFIAEGVRGLGLYTLAARLALAVPRPMMRLLRRSARSVVRAVRWLA